MTKSSFKQLDKEAIDLIRSLDTPVKIQNYIDTKITYDPYREDRSVSDVISDKKGECFNGALFAAACLLFHGYKAGLVEILAREDEEHILCVYKKDGRYGAIAQSKFLGLKSREPIYLTVRDLVASYMEFYFGFDGRYTLHSFTQFFNLDKYAGQWLCESSCVTKIAKDLRSSSHTELVRKNDPFYYVSPERYWIEIQFFPKEIVVPETYLKFKPKI